MSILKQKIRPENNPEDVIYPETSYDQVADLEYFMSIQRFVKLQDTPTSDIIFGQSANSPTQTEFTVSSSSDNNAIPIRYNDGRIAVNAPVESVDAVNLATLNRRLQAFTLYRHQIELTTSNSLLQCNIILYSKTYSYIAIGQLLSYIAATGGISCSGKYGATSPVPTLTKMNYTTGSLTVTFEYSGYIAGSIEISTSDLILSSDNKIQIL